MCSSDLVGDSWGGNLARVDTKTLEVSFVPLPGMQQPYHAAIDSKHNVWTNAWMTDQVLRYDPAANHWTTFDLPTRGTEIRITSLLERGNELKLVFAYARTSKVAVMAVRSEAEMAALKAQVAPNNRATQ